MMAEFATPIYSKFGDVTKVTMEITDYMDLLQYGSTNYDNTQIGVTNGFGFMVDDYALNAGYYLVNLPGTNVLDSKDFIFLDEDGNKTTSYVIDKGQEFDLTKYLTTTDPTFDKDALGQPEFLATLQWKSSNENIVRVKNGKIELKDTKLVSGNLRLDVKKIDFLSSYLNPLEYSVKFLDKQNAKINVKTLEVLENVVYVNGIAILPKD
jgi:hypothetical protein